MRRIALALLLSTGLLALAGCGNKGPLVRAPTHAAATPTQVPASAATAASAAAASTSESSSTAPAYLSPPMPATAASTGY